MNQTSTRLDDQESVRTKVREGYTQVALNTSTGCCSQESPAADPHRRIATNLPLSWAIRSRSCKPCRKVNMGLSCGNPAALAALRPGEVVLDLGSGGGFDVFVAGRKVGAGGRAIGVDMTAEMLSKARRNQAAYESQTGHRNVEFRLGEIEHLPVADASVDAIISNCVINDFRQAAGSAEMARVLKPGGRVAVSDIALLRPLPPKVLEMVQALVGCVAGAVLVADTERMAREAGLSDITLTAKPGYIEAMTDWQDPLYRQYNRALAGGREAVRLPDQPGGASP